MTDGETIQHRHYWGDNARCLGCGIRRCRKWHCNEPRLGDGGALCATHAAPSTNRPEAAPQVSQALFAPAVRVLTYSLPGACRAELR
jgi:hypothetical protein